MNPLQLHFGLDGIVGPALYGGAIIAFLLSVFVLPEIGLYVVIPMLPLETVRYRLLQYPLGHSFIDIMLLGVTLGLLVKKEKLITKTPISWLMLVTALYTYLSLWKGSLDVGLPAPLWFNDPRVSDWKNNLLVPIAVFFLVRAAIQNTKQMKILMFLMCSTAFMLNRSIYNTVRQRNYDTFTNDGRVGSGTISSNGLAAFEVQLGFFLLGLCAFETRWKIRWAYIGMSMFSFYCALFTFSRGAYLAILVTWLVLGLVRMRKLLILLVLFLAVWQSVVPPAVRDRVLMTYDSQDKELDSSAEARVTVWEDAMEVIRVDPIFGVGYLTYNYMHRTVYTDTHNLYVKLWVELGVVGLAVFLLIFWRLYRLGWLLYRTAEDPFFASLGLGFALWMVAAVCVNVFGDRWNYIQINGYMWTFCGIVVRALEIEENYDDESVSPDEPAGEVAESIA